MTFDEMLECVENGCDVTVYQELKICVADLQAQLAQCQQEHLSDLIRVTQDRERVQARVNELEDQLNKPVMKSEWQQLQADLATLRAALMELPKAGGIVWIDEEPTGWIVSFGDDDSQENFAFGLTKQHAEAIAALLRLRQGEGG